MVADGLGFVRLQGLLARKFNKSPTVTHVGCGDRKT